MFYTTSRVSQREVSVHSEFLYGTFANYSPRGTSEIAKRSRIVCGNIKAGKRSQIETALPRLADPAAAVLNPFLNSNTTLVPVPRSAPLSEGALWPAKVIAEVLAEGGYGREVLPLLERVIAVQKSSSSPAKERPLTHEHVESLRVRQDLLEPTSITLVDDVLTMGRTTYACATLLQQSLPRAEIRIFAMIRTQGMIEDIDVIFDPSVGTIVGYPSGKTFRDP